MHKSLLPAFAIVLSAGCAGQTTTSEDWREQLMARARRPAVVAQFCIPSGDVERAAVVSTVRSNSIVNAGAAQVGLTLAKQIVLEAMTAELKELTGLVLTIDRNTYYVFRAERPLTTDNWTPWLMPSNQTRDHMAPHRLLNSRHYEHGAPDADAPKVRYRLMSQVEWRSATAERRNNLALRDLPPC